MLNERYELQVMPLARGGMGEVWEGWDTTLDRAVAVKFVRFPDGVADEEFVRRFMREARATARLQHPGVPAVFDIGTEDGRPFLVMQRIRGRSRVRQDYRQWVPARHAETLRRLCGGRAERRVDQAWWEPGAAGIVHIGCIWERSYAPRSCLVPARQADRGCRCEV